jgi:hypothetical protein
VRKKVRKKNKREIREKEGQEIKLAEMKEGNTQIKKISLPNICNFIP